MSRSAKRPWLAAVLAFVQPGLGHVYLRAWVRSLLWFGLWAGTAAFVVPVPAAGGLVETLLGVVGALDGLSIQATLALASVTAFSTIDAYFLAVRRRARVERADRSQCPHCGHEVDADLEFCHWCTEPLDAAGGDEGLATEESPAR